MNSSYQIKAIYRDKMNIAEFSKIYGIGRGNTFFFTLTFKNNVIDKKEASKMWFNLRSFIQKNFFRFRYIMVSERQSRGAWHFHLLCSAQMPSLNKFIRSVENFCCSSSYKYGFVNARWTSGTDYKGIAMYLTKYLTKERREKCIRYVSYSNNWVRACKMPFAWVGGKSAEWRRRCRDIHSILGVYFKNFYENSTYFEKTTCILSDTLDDSISLVRRWLNSSDEVSRKIFRTNVDKVIYNVEKIPLIFRNYSGEIVDCQFKNFSYEVLQS